MTNENQLAPTAPAKTAEQTPFAGLTPEELAGKATSRASRASTQIIILMLVVGVSVVSLWWMRKEGTRVGVTFQELNVDYTEPNAEKAKTYARIMADLSRIQTPLDVALGEFGKSPFMLDTGKATVAQTGVVMSSGPSEEEAAAALAREKAEARRQELLTGIDHLRLQSVMGGRVPLARISDRTVRVGDVVGEFFTVTGIEGRTVSVEADGQTFTLTMEEKKDSGPRRAPVRLGPPRK